MAKLFIEDTSLTAIGDAIRNKTGGNELLSVPTGMVDAINSITTGGGGEMEPIVLSGSQDYGCAGSIASNYIKLFGNTISTNDITNARNMFFNYSGETIPFDINISGSSCELSHLFDGCNQLKTLPKINFTSQSAQWHSINHFFQACYQLKEIPENYFDNWNFDKAISSTSGYGYSAESLFGRCYSLRLLSLDWLKNMNPKAATTYSYFSNGFNCCYSLNELIDLPIPYTATWTGNIFGYTFQNCSRLKNVTFATQEDGSPKVMNWKSQTMDLSQYVGYSNSGFYKSYILSYNSGITADKEVTDDSTYQALKDDEDWFSCDIAYSRYNHDSAVATINTLPDTSAYLATAGGTNTIKFKGAAGSATDGGAINTLTEEEIAVATAKGWTVSFV